MDIKKSLSLNLNSMQMSVSKMEFECQLASKSWPESNQEFSSANKILSSVGLCCYDRKPTVVNNMNITNMNTTTESILIVL